MAKPVLDRKYFWYKAPCKLINSEGVIYEGFITFRGMSSHESSIYQRKVHIDELKATLFVLDTCVIDEIDWRAQLFGTVNWLLDMVFYLSGLTESSDLIDDTEEWISSTNAQLEIAAMMSIPGLTLEGLRNCDPKDYYKYLVVGRETLALPQQGSAPAQSPHRNAYGDTTPYWVTEESVSLGKPIG